MTASVTVRKFGNSLGIIIPKETAAEMRAEEGTEMHLSKAPDGRFYLSAADPEFARQLEIAQEGIRKYRNALRELAK